MLSPMWIGHFRSACIQHPTSLLLWPTSLHGIAHQLHYLDDSLFLDAPSSDNVARALETVPRVLGIPIAMHKTVRPRHNTLFIIGLILIREAQQHGGLRWVEVCQQVAADPGIPWNPGLHYKLLCCLPGAPLASPRFVLD